MTRKRFKKLLMGQRGHSRNLANWLIEKLDLSLGGYKLAWWIMDCSPEELKKWAEKREAREEA